VNLIGEHTDYQEGFVMPSAVPQRTRTTLTVRDDPRVRLSSGQKPGEIFEFTLGDERRRGEWGDYVQGLTRELANRRFKLCGFDLRIESTVPVGSGLSSSAALEVATLRAIRVAFELPLDDVEIARIAQRAEVDFVGAPVGIMDQMASSLATERAALFLDTRSLHSEQIPLPGQLELVVIDSGVAHQHAGGEYAARRRQSEEAARLMGVAYLRDLDESALDRVAGLPPVLARRARHIITENARVLSARRALLDNNLAVLGELFWASHVSLRDDYEVSIPPVDVLVETAMRQPGVFGARMTGGGFGGAIVIAANAGRGSAIASAVQEEYLSSTGRQASILVPPEREPRAARAVVRRKSLRSSTAWFLDLTVACWKLCPRKLPTSSVFRICDGISFFNARSIF
jgi:galactokinase